MYIEQSKAVFPGPTLSPTWQYVTVGLQMRTTGKCPRLAEQIPRL